MSAPRRRILTTAEGTNRGAFGPVEWGLFSAISLIWGSSFLFIAIGLDAFGPGLVTWLRVTLGALALVGLRPARRRVDAEDWPRLVVLAVFWVAVPFTLFPLAEQRIASSVTGMLNGSMPVFTMTIAALLLRRAPRPPQVAGLAIGFVGLGAISASSASRGTTAAVGVGMVVVATVCYALAATLAAPLQQRYGSIPLMARILPVAAVLTAPMGILSLRHSHAALPSLAAVTVLGVVNTGLALSLMGSLVGRAGSTRASFISYAIPVVALILGVAFRGEHVTIVETAGVALVIAGALLASRGDA